MQAYYSNYRNKKQELRSVSGRDMEGKKNKVFTEEEKVTLSRQGRGNL